MYVDIMRFKTYRVILVALTSSLSLILVASRLGTSMRRAVSAKGKSRQVWIIHLLCVSRILVLTRSTV